MTNDLEAGRVPASDLARAVWMVRAWLGDLDAEGSHGPTTETVASIEIVLRATDGVGSSDGHLLRAAHTVLADREAELLAAKGPCSDNECRLHYAHRGPHDIRSAQGGGEQR